MLPSLKRAGRVHALLAGWLLFNLSFLYLDSLVGSIPYTHVLGPSFLDHVLTVVLVAGNIVFILTCYRNNVFSIEVRTAIWMSFPTALTAGLYWQWLTAPVLDRLSIDQWVVVAIAVALMMGAVLGWLKVSLPAMVWSVLAGQFLGGTCASFQAPKDMIIPFLDELAAAFRHSLELWRHPILLTVGVAAGGLLGHAVKRFANSR
jgi:hypothetical protein